MREGYLDEYIQVNRERGCIGCAFEHFNRNMGYDFCEEIPCYPHMYKHKTKQLNDGDNKQDITNQ